MAKSGNLGCVGCLATLCAFFLAIGLSIAALGFWLYNSYANDPGFWYKEYPGVTRSVASLLLSPFHSPEPLPIPEVAFESESYDSFIAKQTALVEIFQDQTVPARPFQGSFTDKELVVFLMSEMANYGVRNYSLAFREETLDLKASVPAQSLRPYLPADLPEIFFQIYDSLIYLNVEAIVRIGWQNPSLQPLQVQSLKVGSVVLPKAVLERFTLELQVRVKQGEEQIRSRLAANKIQLDSVRLKEGELQFSGLWNVVNAQ